MKNTFFYFLFSMSILFFLMPLKSPAQNPVDSLLLVLKTTQHDTTRLQTYAKLSEVCEYNEIEGYSTKGIELGEKLLLSTNKKIHSTAAEALGLCYNNFAFAKGQQGEFKSAIEFYKKALSLTIREKNESEIAPILNNLGESFFNDGKLEESISYFEKSIVAYKKNKDLEGVGRCYVNLSFVYQNIGDISKALQCIDKGMKIREKVGDQQAIANSWSLFGAIYSQQRELDKALVCFKKCYEINKALKNKEGMAVGINNIGWVYAEKGKFDDAKLSYEEALRLSLEIGDEVGCGKSYQNLSAIFYKKKEIDKAREFLNKALVILKKYDQRDGIASSFCSLGEMEFYYGDINEAEKNGKISMEIAKQIGYPELIVNASELLNLVYRKKGNSAKALEMSDLFYEMRDSIQNEKNRKGTIEQQFKFDYHKKEIEITTKAKLEKEKIELIALEEKQKQRIIIIAIVIILLLVGVFAGFVFNRLKITQKQKNVIEEQKQLVEEKHKEITDSINYAERIQHSFLATTEILDEHLKDYFVFFRPKDVVSGDFYWAGELNNGNFAFSVADSTGHGVPGAIMSILNISSLEKSIEKETAPDQILNKTRKIIIERLKKDGSTEGGKDGMDCSLLVLNQDRTQLSFAAANNPVFILRPTVIASCHSEPVEESMLRQALHDKNDMCNVGYELLEFKPDKMPVGKHDNDKESFTLHSTILKKGDVIYALTDGFPDQFGGDKGKKYMIKNLKELLLQIAHLPMLAQEQKLAEEFDKWKGSNEQVDDVCIIGVRI